MSDVINQDMLNAFRFLLQGVDVIGMTANDSIVEDSLYNAVAFCDANDLGNFYDSPEWFIAVDEYWVHVIGVQFNL